MRIIVTYENRVGPQVFTFNNVDAATKWMQRLLRQGLVFNVTYERPETT